MQRRMAQIEESVEEMQRLEALDVWMLAAPGQQISLADPDARSMATSGRGSGVVGYNVRVAVDTKHHLIVRTDRSPAWPSGRTFRANRAPS